MLLYKVNFKKHVVQFKNKSDKSIVKVKIMPAVIMTSAI